MFRVLVLCAAILEVFGNSINFENGVHYLLKAGEEAAAEKSDADWWKTAVFYQIYPRSYMDSNNDGIGDLQGIIQRMDHLVDMGVTAIWLSPIFKSPQVDQGYDISDYRDVDSDYGTLDDLKQLLEAAHKVNIKVILDFVPNHTSDKHLWFTESVKGNETYKDYYVWVDGKLDADNKTRIPPNNWLSYFKGSAWEWNESRKQFYLHQFASAQPDLNYRNPKVVEDMKAVLTFWLEFGVDGFRCDAVPTLFEDKDLKDEPLSGLEGVSEDEHDYLDHIYTTDQDETFDMIYQFRQVLDDFSSKKNGTYPVMMTESYSSITKIMRYYGATNGTTLGAHFTFNFNFITDLSKDFDIDDIANCIHKWQTFKPKQFTSNWVLGNHDNHRVATRLGEENVDAFNMLVSILPGVQVTYNGEEIGMEDGEVTCEQGHDPQAIGNCTTFAKFSRDFERTPYQWDNTTNAGFNKGNTTWLPVSKNYEKENLDNQNVTNAKSHYNVYKTALTLRQKLANAQYDSLSLVKLSNNVLQVIRRTDQVEFVYLFNAGSASENITIYKHSGYYNIVLVSTNSNYTVGDEFSENVLGPHESLILEATDKSGAAREHALPLFVISGVYLFLKYVID